MPYGLLDHAKNQASNSEDQKVISLQNLFHKKHWDIVAFRGYEYKDSLDYRKIACKKSWAKIKR